MAANLCCVGWLEVYGIILSMKVGFLKTAMFTPVGVLWIVLYCIVFLFYSFNAATWGHSPKDIEHVKNHVM